VYDQLIRRLKNRAKDPEQAFSMLQEPREDTPFRYYEPLTLGELHIVEYFLGFKLPPLMRDIYTQVGNGGFGPGYGLTGLTDDGHPDCLDMNAADLYAQFQSMPENGFEWNWPRKILPICDLACNVMLCIDCNTVGGRILAFDPSIDVGEPFRPKANSLQHWLEAWLNGTLPE